MYTLSKGEKAERIGQISIGEKTDIEIDWGTSGKLIVRVGNGRPRELAVSTGITSVAVSASTGEFKLDPIALGQFAR